MLNLNLNFFEPQYFHREYENDLDKSKPCDQSAFDQCLRVTQVALPFISLYKPIGQPLTLGLGVVRSISCISQLVNAIKKGEKAEIGLAVLQTAISVSTVAGTIFAHPLGMLITTSQDLILNISQLITALAEKDNKKALEISMQLANNLLYLGLFFTGAPQALIASTFCQILIGMYQSMDEFKKGNYLQGCGHLLISNIRAHQLYVQVDAWRNIPIPVPLEPILIEGRETSLINAIESGDVESVELLLKSGADVNIVTTEKKCAITAALYHPTILERVIDKGGNVNVKLTQKMTPLHYAAQSEITHEALCILIKNGADVNAVDLYGRTPLHSATNNSLKNTKILLDNGANFHSLDDNGWKPLHIAYQSCNIDILKTLVKRGASLNEFTPWGCNALHHACGFSSSDKVLKFNLIKYLIEEKKMNVNEQANYADGKTGAGTAFLRALGTQNFLEDDFELLDYLLDKGADLNSKMFTQIGAKINIIHNSVLPYAKAQKIPQYIIQWLIEKGAR